MADDEKKGSTPAEDALFFFCALVILVALWYFAGGPGKTDLRGIFLSPPEPLGTGDAYGPQFGVDASSTPRVEPPPTFQPTY